jgi:GNAT superfamily N-acetyltransferase
MIHEQRHGNILVSTDQARLDIETIHGFLTGSYWAQGVPREVVERSVRHSMCFGAFEGDRQVGFARVITDRATFAYVADVFVLPTHRGRNIGKHLMACITSHPELQNLRLWALFTRDAHGLYRQYGFREARYPDRLMERRTPDPYGPVAAAGGGIMYPLGSPSAAPRQAIEYPLGSPSAAPRQAT